MQLIDGLTLIMMNPTRLQSWAILISGAMGCKNSHDRVHIKSSLKPRLYSCLAGSQSGSQGNCGLWQKVPCLAYFYSHNVVCETYTGNRIDAKCKSDGTVWQQRFFHTLPLEFIEIEIMDAHFLQLVTFSGLIIHRIPAPGTGAMH